MIPEMMINQKVQYLQNLILRLGLQKFLDLNWQLTKQTLLYEKKFVIIIMYFIKDEVT